MSRPAKSPAPVADVEKVRTFTGWKLDLQRAVRADHKTPPGASALFAAILDHVNIDTRRAWPSVGMLAILTGVSDKTVRKYLAQLIEAKWLLPVGESNRGTTIYEVLDYRMNAVLDQIAIEIDRHREREKRRQEINRQKRRASKAVTEHGFRLIGALSRNTGSELSRNTGSDEHLHKTPSSQILSEEGENPYARAKGRAS